MRKKFQASLINVGAGLTSYPFLLSDAVSSVYLDQPRMLDFFKDRAQAVINAGELPRRKIEYSSIDLNADDGLNQFEKLLTQQVQPVFVLFEGILTYLHKPAALQLVHACAKNLPIQSRVEVHVGLNNFSSSQVWHKIGQFFDTELGLPVPELTCFDPQEITTIPGLRLIEHVGFRDIQKRLGLEKHFMDDQLIDERFFLLEK